MAHSDEVDRLSRLLGAPLRKVTRTDVFASLRLLLDRIDWVATSLTPIEATGYELDDPLCELGDHGQLLALYWPEATPIPADALSGLREMRILIAPSLRINPAQAQALAMLPHLECVGFELSGADGAEILRHITPSTSIKTLYCGGVPNSGSLDASAFIGLKSLVSLIVEILPLTRLESLAGIESLRHLALRIADDASATSLRDAAQLETLGLLESADIDCGFLADMPNLKALKVDGQVPPPILSRLTGLRDLTTKFAEPSLESLRSLTGLDTLCLTDADIRDFSGLEAFPLLTRLSLADGGTTDVSGLKGHPGIELLDLSNVSVSEVAGDWFMPRLKHLIWPAKSVKLEDASFLSTCRTLEVVRLDGHALADLSFVGPLGALRTLSACRNQIADVSPLAFLPNLSVLDLAGNQIPSVAPLAGNVALTTMTLDDNPVGDIQAIGTLQRLETLSLERTGIADLTFIKRLKQLFRLEAAGNHISQAEPLLELPHIASVDLSKNAFTSVPKELVQLGSLASLNLEGNPIEGIDSELYDSGDGRKTLVSLRDYFRGLSRGRVRNDQVKIVLVGNGRVGKTSVVSRLIDNEFDDAQPSTHGIQLRQWTLPNVAQDRLQGAPLRVSVWDFGGQDIYHATHRIFMRTRALFLLVWDKDTEERRYSLDESGERYENFRLPYWIDYIKALSGSPVIVVQNKVDALQDNRPTYGVDLQAMYPPPAGILDYLHVSAMRSEHNGIPSLVGTIALALDALPSVGRELPEQWMKVWERVTEIDRRYLAFGEFAEICESVGLDGTAPMSLANFLHEAGVFFYQPPSFGDRIILDQRWAIDAVYALFDRRGAAYTDLKLAGRNGLSLDLLTRKVWRQFSADEHSLLLEFMKSCEMCFELSKEVYYVPQLLPDERPPRVALRWQAATDYSLQITYPFVHRAIIDRFLVRSGKLGADSEPEIWKNGVALFEPATQSEALVEALPAENRILAQAKGPAAVALLQAIAAEFDLLHAGFPAVMSVSADASQHFVEIGALRRHAQARAVTVPDLIGQPVALAPLVAFIETPPRRPSPDAPRLLSRSTIAMPGAVGAEENHIFLSYAWGDRSEAGESREAIVDRLYDALVASTLKVVRDKQDSGYRTSITDFMKRIGHGRLVVVVVSDKYLRSPYCMFELLEIYEQLNFKNRVMPIVLPDAKLYDLESRLEYVLYWKQKKEAIEALIRKLDVDAFSSEGTYREFDLFYRRVFHNVDKLTSLLGDWNALNPKLLEENSFAAIVNAIQHQLDVRGAGAN